MPTSVPNFNFLAPLVSEIWSGPKIKKMGCCSSHTPPSGHILHGAIVPAKFIVIILTTLPLSVIVTVFSEKKVS